MLAAGISTHRAIRPVLISSVIVSSSPSRNQELIMPRFAEELAKDHDDDGQRTVHVSGRYDARGSIIHGVDADRATKTIFPFYATLDPSGSSARSETSRASRQPTSRQTIPRPRSRADGWCAGRRSTRRSKTTCSWPAASVLHRVDNTKRISSAVMFPSTGEVAAWLARRAITREPAPGQRRNAPIRKSRIWRRCAPLPLCANLTFLAGSHAAGPKIRRESGHVLS